MPDAGKMMRYGVFGGTFDPPHLGHLILSAEAGYQLALDKVLWVLTPDPPHKQGRNITPAGIREEMVKAAIGSEPQFELSRVDIDRPPPTYALDSVRIVKAQNPGVHVVYLMGGDSLHDLPAWYEPEAFVEACDEIGVMCRPGDRVNLDDLLLRLPKLEEKIRFVDAPLLEISSSEIRERARLGAPIKFYLPEFVYKVIQTYGLYGLNSK